MKHKSLYLLAIVVFVIACQSKLQKAEKAEISNPGACQTELNTLSETEQSEGWLLLFNGKTPQGWRGVNKAHFPAVWEISDGALHGVAGNKEAGHSGEGDIIYDKKFRNFHLKLEWKIGEGGNSGIFYLGQEVPGWPLYKTAPEMQLLDNAFYAGESDHHKAGSLYDLIPADPQNARPAGEWNSIEIVCNKSFVEHKQNGVTVLTYQIGNENWKSMIENSEFYQKTNPDMVNVADEGYIGLQFHGDDVWFRNIKIKEL